MLLKANEVMAAAILLFFNASSMAASSLEPARSIIRAQPEEIDFSDPLAEIQASGLSNPLNTILSHRTALYAEDGTVRL
jgi:hypothetical protein